MNRSGVNSRSVMARAALSSDRGWQQLGRMVIFVVVALGIAHMTSLILISVYRHNFWSEQASQTAARIAALKAEVRELEVRARKARSDPRYLEELARHQGFVRKSEHVIVPAPTATLPVEEAPVPVR